MDAGLGNSGTSWYEMGFDTAAPTTGLPHPGVIFTSQTSSTHQYIMAPSYATNDAILIDSTLKNSTLVLTTPTICSQLSFLESAGHGPVSFKYTVHHASGASDTGTGSSVDWFTSSTAAWTANGRVDVGTFALSSVNGNDPRLFSLDITLANTTNPVTSIDFTWVSGTGEAAVLAVSGGTGGTFSPLIVTGYNEDIIVEAAAGTSLSGFTTATMDTGLTNTLNTFFEEGYDPSAPLVGIPPAGSTFTSASAPDHLYVLPASYAANNALLLTSNTPTGTMTLSSAVTEKGLSFLCSAGNGPVTVGYVVHHSGGATESNTLVVQDWFSYSPVACFANGRVNVSSRTVNNINASNPCLYSVDVTLNNTAPVASVTLTWLSGENGGNAAFFALSGGSSTLPFATDDFNTNSAVAANVMQQWYNQSGLYNSTGWWNAANCLEGLETVIAADHQLQYLSVLTNTLVLNSNANFLNGYYDDEGWWANAWIHAYDLTGSTNFLRAAKIIFSDMSNSWNSANCNGGIWWDRSETYKNAIANELFMLAAIRLHQRTPNDTGAGSYLAWATNEYNWFLQSTMINSEYLINDGLTNCVNNGGPTFTYNQGVIIGALTDLYKVTGVTNYLTLATSIAHAVVTNLSSGHVLVEGSPCDPTCGGGDVPEFKGICIRNIAYLYDVTHDPQLYTLLYDSAHSIWFVDRNVYNQLGMSWAGVVDAVDAARQSSALAGVAALAQPITTNLLFVRGAGDPSFTHAIGSATGALGWTCGPTNAQNANYMLSGPHVAYLPPGLHAAHFQLSVDALSNSPASLAILSVLEDNSSTILATAPVPWSAFTQVGVPQDFVVLFTNNVAGDPLQFRIFWTRAAGGPDLTANDVAIDGLMNWSGANLIHDIGHLDGLNAWAADLRSSTLSGYLSRGPGINTLPTGDYTATFELKVDNFNYDTAVVATVSVIDMDTGVAVSTEAITRNQFPNTLYQPFTLSFNAVAGTHYDFRTYWYRSANAPRLTQRSVFLRPGPQAFFTSVQWANGAPQFAIAGVPGRTYSLQATPDLTLPWSTIGTVTIPANLGFASAADAAGTAAKFYRLSYP